MCLVVKTRVAKGRVSAAGSDFLEGITEFRVFVQEGAGEKVKIGGMWTGVETSNEDESVVCVDGAALVCLASSERFTSGYWIVGIVPKRENPRVDGGLEWGKGGHCECWSLAQVRL